MMLACSLGCSTDDRTAVSPDVHGTYISEIQAPVDTIHFRSGSEVMIYDCEGVRVRGDCLLDEFHHVMGTVQPALVPGEELGSVGIGTMPSCFLLPYDGRDLSAQTCVERDSSGVCLGGRYFSFVRVDGALRLWEVGQWSHP
jgi:hypothetical protein